MDQTHTLPVAPLHILTEQPKFAKNRRMNIPRSPSSRRCSWSSDSGFPEEAGTLEASKGNPVVRRAFAVDFRETRRRVISLGSEPEHIRTSCVSRLQLSELDVRRIVNEILDEFQSAPEGSTLPPSRVRRISSTSCSTGCYCSSAGCSNSSCCYDCSPDSTLRRHSSVCSSRSTSHPLDIPRRQRFGLTDLPEVHSSSFNPYRHDGSSGVDCTCYTSYFDRSSVSFPTYKPFASIAHSSPIWTTSSCHPCRKCLPIFEKDSLNSTISADSLNDISIFSLDSLNSLTDKDSLEYGPTSLSDDSLNSLDCNFDSLSESKDSGFFSCSLPVVC